MGADGWVLVGGWDCRPPAVHTPTPHLRSHPRPRPSPTRGMVPTIPHPPHPHRFAGMVVTLSSGCAETWARGCCATLLCSNSPAACPFQASELQATREAAAAAGS